MLRMCVKCIDIKLDLCGFIEKFLDGYSGSWRGGAFENLIKIIVGKYFRATKINLRVYS